MDGRLTIVLPSLPAEVVGLLSNEAIENELASSISLTAPNLQRVLARANKSSQSNNDWHSRLAEQFSLSSESLPVAALRAKADGLEVEDSNWLCADIVHLRPDLDHILLFDSTSFDYVQAECNQLFNELNKLFVDESFEFIYAQDGRGYCRLSKPVATIFTPLSQVHGKNILPFLPKEGDEKFWRRTLNEIQMKLTVSDVNQARENQGYVGVNGLWLWGVGPLPKLSNSVFSKVFCNDAFAKGLAQCSQVEHANLDGAGVTSLFSGEEVLLVDDGLCDKDDLANCVNKIEAIEKCWITPAVKALRNGSLKELRLSCDGVSYRLTSGMLRRWWRRDLKALDVLKYLSGRNN